MSMYPQELGSVPEETARVARAANPKGTLAMRLRDTLGELYQEQTLRVLFHKRYEGWEYDARVMMAYIKRSCNMF